MSKDNMSSISSKSSETKMNTRSRTDWERLDAMTDEDIDTSDIPPMTEEQFARSEWRFPSSTQAGLAPPAAVTVEVIVDGDTLVWFQSQGQDYQQRMRAALRLYAEAHKTAA